ncbi:MAG: hypothetical protein OXU27_09660, partial [Candidatus Poribacteria bacterium]|nr:hypothetical protein [Candidatus Poribacteria bacterium]
MRLQTAPTRPGDAATNRTYQNAKPSGYMSLLGQSGAVTNRTYHNCTKPLQTAPTRPGDAATNRTYQNAKPSG